MHRATTFAPAVVVALLLAFTGVVTGVPVVGGADTGGVDTRGSMANGPLAVEDPGVTADYEAETDRMPVPVEFAYERGSTEDVVQVTMEVRDTGGLEAMTTHVQPHMTVESTDGFVADGEDYVWDGETDRPTLTYRQDLSAAIVGTHWDEDSLITVADTPAVVARDAGDAIYAEAVETLSVDGPGTTAEHVVVLGNYTEHERTAGEQRLRLIVPESVDPERTPSSVIGSIANASTDLSVGAEDDVVHGVVTPGTNADATDQTFFLAADASTEAAIQAYVESQVEFSVGGDGGREVLSGLPDYYGSYLAVENGYADADAFETALDTGHRKPALAWTDRQIRLATDGERTLQDVFRRLNGQSGVTLANYSAAVAEVGNESIAETSVAYLREDDEPPESWPDGAFEAAYGYRPADTEVGIAGIQARGADWNRTLSPDAYTLTVGVNESLAVRTEGSNDGGIAGRVALPRTLAAPNGTVLVDRPGRTWLHPGSNRTALRTFAFRTTGNYSLAVADEDWRVRVLPMDDTVTVTELDVPENVTATTTIDVTARVGNTDETPSRATVAASVNGSHATTERVLLGPVENRTVTLPVHVDEAGPRRIAVGERATTIDVDGTGWGVGALGPGFGPVVTLLAVLAAVLVGGRGFGRTE